jgi:hypothetical protein
MIKTRCPLRFKSRNSPDAPDTERKPRKGQFGNSALLGRFSWLTLPLLPSSDAIFFAVQSDDLPVAMWPERLISFWAPKG